MRSKYRVELVASAEADVRAIRDHIAADKPIASRKWVADLSKKIASLDRFPLRHPQIPEAGLLGVDYRHLIVGDDRVIYRMEDDRVIVIRVVHGARGARVAVGGPTRMTIR